MDFKLIKAGPAYARIFSNLLQFYMYDFSEYGDHELMADGSYPPYKGLQHFWKGEGKFPYLVITQDQYAGFVLVKTVDDQQPCFSIAEFFILKKYRRQGMGKAVALQIFNLHKGNWQVQQLALNKPAQLFWQATINEYTGGEFYERSERGRVMQEFSNGEGVVQDLHFQTV